jgi:hexosaminidase
MEHIVPAPVSLKTLGGSFKITSKTQLFVSPPDQNVTVVAQFLLDPINRASGLALSAKPLPQTRVPKGSIILALNQNTAVSNSEGYTLEILADGIVLSAPKPAGLFYGVQTLLQLLPVAVFCEDDEGTTEMVLPALRIQDWPRFPYRGMHLDVSRHFFPADFIKRYIDLIALHKMNVFHWHLTDDNGWRLEINRYPGLTETSAWRVDREEEPWRSRKAQQPGEKATYGGFYTQDEVREIVEYASTQHVTVIPEIEMPGHTSEVLAAYPELSCTGGPFTVATGGYWPNVDIFCAGNDSVFVFIQNVLTEVMDLFPGPYIHIGGDEADKRRWRACDKCQARIQKEGLKDEAELQSYFIKRVEKFLSKHNKRLVGWDEILQGGLAPEATVMSWRGVDGGIAAAKMGHDVVMTPTTHCYFDYYQADPEFEPVAIGGFTTLKRVYSFEPVPPTLTDKEAQHILGAQGNVWTEFISTPSHAEYMSVPRMSALAEVNWTPRESRNWQSFRERLEVHKKRLDEMGVKYSNGSYAVEIRTVPDVASGSLAAVLSSEQLNTSIHYTLDGDEPSLESPEYSSRIGLERTTSIRAAVFEKGKLKESASEKTVLLHKGVGKTVRYNNPYTGRYVSDDTYLVDGLNGSLNPSDGYWQGFEGEDVDLLLDLGTTYSVTSLSTTFLEGKNSIIIAPSVVEFEVSLNGVDFQRFSNAVSAVVERGENALRRRFQSKLPEPQQIRFIRVRASNGRVCPPGHIEEGLPAWLYIDEIVVN